MVNLNYSLVTSNTYYSVYQYDKKLISQYYYPIYNNLYFDFLSFKRTFRLVSSIINERFNG